MRFVASVLAVSAVMSAVPAQAAVLIEAFGNGTAVTYGPDLTSSYRYGGLGLRVVVSDAVLDPAYMTGGSFFISLGNEFSASLFIIPDDGADLLAGGTGTGRLVVSQKTFRGVPMFDFQGGASFRTTRVSSAPTSYELFAVAVPEPSTWAMMIAGFGAVGVAARRRRAYAPTS